MGASNTISLDASAAGTLSSTPVTLMGFCFTEAAATPTVARVRLRDGTSATAPVLYDVKIPANDSKPLWLGPQGVRCTTGLYLEIVAGTVAGNVQVA